MPSEEQTRQKNGRAAGYSYKEKVSVEPCGQKSYDQCRDPGPDVVCSRDYRGEGHDERSQRFVISFLNTRKGSILMQYTVRHMIRSER